MESLVNVADLESIPPGKARTVEVSGRRFALANVDGQVFAIADRCPHRAGPLGEGYVEGCVLHCPLHGWGFDVRTGACDVRPDRPVASRQDRQQPQGMPDVTAMIARLEARLAEKPDDLDGWLMLGRSRAVLGDMPATTFFRHNGTSAADPESPILPLPRYRTPLLAIRKPRSSYPAAIRHVITCLRSQDAGCRGNASP